MHPCEGKQVRSEVNWNNVQVMLRWGISSHKYSATVLGVFTDTTKTSSWLTKNISLMGAGDKQEFLSSPMFHNLAFSAAGLKKLSLNVDENFPFEFAQGMTSARATHVLGDDSTDWDWGKLNDEDFALIIYSQSIDALDNEIARLTTSAGADGVQLKCLRSYLDTHEHFGFKDGIANPKIRGASSRTAMSQTIAPGEFIFGYPDERGLYPPPPLQAGDKFNDLPVSADDTNKHEIGRDGSFLVIRQLQQYPDAFNAYLNNNATQELSAETLGAKMMGRWKDGSPLTLAPDKPDASLGAADDFGFYSNDKEGERCPIGAHIRRSNPRDTLTDDPIESLQISNRHRILRRSRMYNDEANVGLVFMCFNTSFSRQFEHIQETWINGKRFARINERDPIIGNRQGNSDFTFPNGALPTQVKTLPDFVKTIGGGYFFLPALDVYQKLVESSDGDKDVV